LRNTYIELHAHSYYSLLDGASSPKELVRRAAALGMPALALTDHDGLYGAVEFWRAAREAGVHPIIGAEVTLSDGAHLTLLTESPRGYSNLCRLISRAQLAGHKNNPVLAQELVQAHAEGLICLSGCRQGPITQAIMAKDYRRAVQVAEILRETFGPDNFYVELQRHLLPDAGRLTGLLVRLADYLGVGVVATNNVHYATPEGQPLHDVLTCIRHHTTLELGHSWLWPNGERYLKSPAQMTELFADHSQAIRNTRRIAERCVVSLDTFASLSTGLSAYRLPDFPVPPDETPLSYLYQLCQAGARERYQPVTPAVRRQLAHELDVIQRTNLATFFLVVWDIAYSVAPRRNRPASCREHNIPCQGRGSAANSLVAYVVGGTPPGITAVDPLAHDLLFERFLSEEGNTTPDIDLDISTAHRDQVIEYVYDTYGEEHTAMVCNVVTFRARSAIRDVGKVMGFPPGVVDRIARAIRGANGRQNEVLHAIDAHSDAPLEDQLASACGEKGTEGTRPNEFGTGTNRNPLSSPSSLSSLSTLASLLPDMFLDLCRQIEGVPRHLSIHNGGMLITACPLIDIVPLERATMPGRVVAQWNKDSVEDAGLIKVDLLGLRTLSLIHEAVELIRKHEGTEINIQALPLDDPKVYDLLCAADTIGAFQVESRAQTQLLPRLRPRRFEDLVVAVDIIRPGPIQGDADSVAVQRNRRPPLPAPARWRGARRVPAPAAGGPIGRDLGRDAVSGAGFAGGDGRGRLLPRPGRRIAARHESRAVESGYGGAAAGLRGGRPGARG